MSKGYNQNKNRFYKNKKNKNHNPNSNNNGNNNYHKDKNDEYKNENYFDIHPHSKEEYKNILETMEHQHIDKILNEDTCPCCNEKIIDFYSTVTHKIHNKKVHLACILKEIQQKEQLRSNEQICYMGNGTFAICSYQDLRGRYRFFIRKRIQYEDRKINSYKHDEDD